MSKAGIIALITGVALTIVGALVVFFVFLGVGFDFTKLNYNITDGSSHTYVEKTYDVSNSFESITIENASSDIIFEKSEDDSTRVLSYDRDDVNYDVKVKNNTLSIKSNPKNNLELLSISFNSPDTYITVYLPEKAYNELTIKAASSDINLPAEFEFKSIKVEVASGDVSVDSKVSESLSVNAASSDLVIKSSEANDVKLHTASGEITIDGIKNSDNIDVSTASGKVEITDVKASNLKVSTASGEQSLRNVVAENKMDLHSGSGEIYMYGCDAKDIDVSTASAELYAELLTGKNIVTDTASGNVDVAHEAHGENGNCTVKTASGDITIVLNK